MVLGKRISSPYPGQKLSDFADDIFLLLNTAEKFEKVTDKVASKRGKAGLIINVKSRTCEECVRIHKREHTGQRTTRKRNRLHKPWKHDLVQLKS